MNTLHQVKATRLEAQLSHAKQEVEKYEKEVEELQSKLRLQTAFSSVDPGTSKMASGLCVRCAQSEAVLPSTYGSQQKSIDKITR